MATVGAVASAVVPSKIGKAAAGASSIPNRLGHQRTEVNELLHISYPDEDSGLLLGTVDGGVGPDRTSSAFDLCHKGFR